MFEPQGGVGWRVKRVREHGQVAEAVVTGGSRGSGWSDPAGPPPTSQTGQRSLVDLPSFPLNRSRLGQTRNCECHAPPRPGPWAGTSQLGRQCIRVVCVDWGRFPALLIEDPHSSINQSNQLSANYLNRINNRVSHQASRGVVHQVSRVFVFGCGCRSPGPGRLSRSRWSLVAS